MRRMPTLKVMALTLMPILLLTACAQSPVNSQTAITQADVTSVAVTPVEKLTDVRIVALANGAAELIAAMGYRDNLVGRDIASSTTELKDVPIVTSGHQVIPETIIALQPTLVIVDDATGPSNAISKLESAGIRIVNISQSWNLVDLLIKVDQLGSAIKAPQSAALLRNILSESVNGNSVGASATDKKLKVAFLYLRGTSSIYLVGGQGSGADYLINATGAIDVGAQKLSKPFTPLTAETMAQLNPDLILVMIAGLESVGGVSGLVELPGIAQTGAGKNRQIVAVDDSLLLSFGPRTPSLISELAVAFGVIANA
ncbi:MAG: ABC transporter substrate-binding protein [Actinobacteria bacterium]|nr:ABC transporter substrate-binding protein [Actinomycetota bacterium]